MDKLQIVFFFISGFLVSRLIIAAGLPERIVGYVIGRKHIGMPRLVFYLIAISAFLSFFVPNVITVLTMLPILTLLRDAFDRNGSAHPVTPTLLALSVIYGSNIGGMGVITGTPANGIMLAFAEAESIPGIKAVQYVTWLKWGVPLVLCLIVLSWLVMAAALRPWRVKESIVFQPRPDIDNRLRRRWALFFAALYFLSSTFLSGLMLVYEDYGTAILIVSGAFTALFSLTLFLAPLTPRGGATGKAPLLTIRDCYSDLPVRGFAFVGAAVVIAGVLYAVGANKIIAHWLVSLTPKQMGLFFFLLAAALITSFSTEILSNTAAQIGMFALVAPMAQSLGFSPLKVMTVITLSCTCAFMSPIATGVNGLAFGGLRGVSLWRMLVTGLIMNTLAAVVIALWVEYITPW